MHLCPAPALPCSDCSKRRQTSKACLPIDFVWEGTTAMNKVADFSDTLADRWDELCYHDPEKLNDILRRSRPAERTPYIGHRMRDRRIGKLSPALFPLTNRGSGNSPGWIEKARSKYATPIVDFRCQDVRDIRGESFDYIIAYSVFPHFPGTRETDLPFSRTTAGWRQTGGLPQRKPRQDQRTP